LRVVHFRIRVLPRGGAWKQSFTDAWSTTDKQTAVNHARRVGGLVVLLDHELALSLPDPE
jgi:hypothetical protein